MKLVNLFCIIALLAVSCKKKIVEAEPIKKKEVQVDAEPKLICNDVPWYLTGAPAIWEKYGTGEGVRVVVDETDFDINNEFIGFNQKLSKDLRYPNGITTEWALTHPDEYHGTAVSGLVRQACPDCDIVAVRREGSRPRSYIKTLRYADSIKADVLVSAVQLPYYSDLLEDWYDNNESIKIYYAAPRPDDEALGGMYDHEKVEVIGAMDWNYQPTDYTNQIYADRYYRIGNSAVWTSDVEGINGKYQGDFMPDFGGTSAATPLVAGLEACKINF